MGEGGLFFLPFFLSCWTEEDLCGVEEATGLSGLMAFDRAGRWTWREVPPS